MRERERERERERKFLYHLAHMEWMGASYIRQSFHPRLSCAFIFIKLSIRHELIEGRRETLRYYLLLPLMRNQAYLIYIIVGLD